jgi:hypothetical protein
VQDPGHEQPQQQHVPATAGGQGVAVPHTVDAFAAALAQALIDIAFTADSNTAVEPATER